MPNANFGRCSHSALRLSDADDHHFCGLDQGCCGLSILQLHFPDGSRSDQGCDELASYRQGDLGDKAADTDINDAADQLVAAADALVGDAPFAFVAAARAIKQAIDLSLWDAVMSAGRLYAAQF